MIQRKDQLPFSLEIIRKLWFSDYFGEIEFDPSQCRKMVRHTLKILQHLLEFLDGLLADISRKNVKVTNKKKLDRSSACKGLLEVLKMLG